MRVIEQETKRARYIIRLFIYYYLLLCYYYSVIYYLLIQKNPSYYAGVYCLSFRLAWVPAPDENVAKGAFQPLAEAAGKVPAIPVETEPAAPVERRLKRRSGSERDDEERRIVARPFGRDPRLLNPAPVDDQGGPETIPEGIERNGEAEQVQELAELRWWVGDEFHRRHAFTNSLESKQL